jgi:hypothetical protein
LPGRRAIASVLGCVLGGIPFGILLSGFGWNPTRTAVAQGFASNFFDLQARALLDGHLWLPTGSLGIEGFVEDGRTYMYFPPFPSLLRLPVLLTTAQFDGRLTVASMAAAWLVFATMTCRLLWAIREGVRPAVPLGRLEAVAFGILIAALTGGTTLTFDAALPWVYHEVYLWSAALVVSGLYWLLRHLREPSRTTLGWLGACATAAILTRFPGGAALAFACLLAGVLILAGRLRPRSQNEGWALVTVGALTVVVSMALNWAKFRHPYLFPLEDQVWTQVNERRREALAINGGTITGPQFVPTGLTSYLGLNGVRFVDYFPWITLPAKPPSGVAGAFLDQSYRTGSVPALMPLLTLLSVIAPLPLLRRRRSLDFATLRILYLCGVVAVLPVLAYGYVTNRYTSDFVPLLVVGGGLGLVVLWPRQARTLPSLTVVALMAVLTAYSLAAQFLTGWSAYALTARGDALDRYVLQQIATGGGPGGRLSRQVVRSQAMPSGGRTDDLFVRGDCDALYINSGDQYEPWITVEQKPEVYTLVPGPTVTKGRAVLLTISASATREVVLETKDDRSARFVVQDRLGQVAGPWFGLYAGSSVRLGIGVRSDTGMAVVSSTPGGFVADVPWAFWGRDWVARPGSVQLAANAQAQAAGVGLDVSRTAGVDAPICRRLLSSVQ